MLSLQSAKGESCVICPSRKRLAAHSTLYFLHLRTRAHHGLQGVVKVIDGVYPGMRMGKLPCWNGTVSGKLHMMPMLASQKTNDFNAGRYGTEQPLRTDLAGLSLKAVYGR